MDTRMQKHRTTRWLGRLFVVFSVVMSSGANAAVESASPVRLWCNPYAPPDVSCIYPTDSAAAQAEAASYNSLNAGLGYTDVIYGCDGQGLCYYITYDWNGKMAASGPLYIGSSFPNCPIPTTNPTVRYTYNATRGMCERTADSCPANMSGSPCACNTGYVPNPSGAGCVAESFTITLDQKSATLEPAGTAAQKVNTSQKFIATVTGTRSGGKVGAKVTIKVDVEEHSGGHNHHDANRPKGTLSSLAATACDQKGACITGTTDGNGQFTFSFNSTDVSGTHNISASCDVCNNNPQGASVYVKVPGLNQIPSSIFFSKISPNADTNHPNTNYLTTEASARLQELGLQYSVMGLEDFGMVLPPLQINDASLEFGGVLDCFLTCNRPEFPSTPWHKHHIEHRRGTVVDIRANGGNGSVPKNAKMTESFIAMARNLVLSKYPASKAGVPIAGIHGKRDGRHFHVQLLGIKE